VQQGASTSLPDLNFGNTPLLVASGYGQLAVLQWLLAGHASLNETNHEGNNALHLASLNGRLDTVRYLVLEKNMNVSATNKHGSTPLLLAARAGHLPILQWLLNEGGSSYAECSIAGNNALLVASFYGHKDVVSWLVNVYNADVRVANNVNNTPLHFALRGENYDVARYLINKGADVFALNGHTPPMTPIDELTSSQAKTKAFFEEYASLQQQLESVLDARDRALERATSAERDRDLEREARRQLTHQLQKLKAGSVGQHSTTNILEAKSSVGISLKPLHQDDLTSFIGKVIGEGEKVVHSKTTSNDPAVKAQIAMKKAFYTATQEIVRYVEVLIKHKHFSKFVGMLSGLMLLLRSAAIRRQIGHDNLEAIACRLATHQSNDLWPERIRILMIFAQPNWGLLQVQRRLVELAANAIAFFKDNSQSTASLYQMMQKEKFAPPPHLFRTPLAFELFVRLSSCQHSFRHRSVLVRTIDPTQIHVDWNSERPVPGSSNVYYYPAKLIQNKQSVRVQTVPATKLRPVDVTLASLIYHNNILKFIGCWYQKDNVHFATVETQATMQQMIDKASRGTKRKAVGSFPSLEEVPLRIRLTAAARLCDALAYCHEHDLVLETLRPRDIFLQRDTHGGYDMVLADHKIKYYPNTMGKDQNSKQTLAWGTNLDRSSSSSQETIPELYWILSPERIWSIKSSGKDLFTPSSDVYSFGFLLWALISCEDPSKTLQMSAEHFISQKPNVIYKGLQSEEIIQWITQNAASPLPRRWRRGEFSQILTGKKQHSLFQLLYSCWAVEPQRRPTARSVARQLARLVSVVSLKELCVSVIIAEKLSIAQLPPDLYDLF